MSAKIAFNLIAAMNAYRYAQQLALPVGETEKKLHSIAVLMTSALHSCGYTSDTVYHKGKVPMFTRYPREERARNLMTELTLFAARNGHCIETGKLLSELGVEPVAAA